MISLRDSTTASLSRSKKTQAKKLWKESFESAIQQLSLAEAAADAQEKFWIELKLEIAKKGVWGLLIVICGLIVVGVSAKLGLPK